MVSKRNRFSVDMWIGASFLSIHDTVLQYNRKQGAQVPLWCELIASWLQHNCILYEHHSRRCPAVDDVVFFLPVHSALSICSDYGASLLLLLLLINKAAVTPPASLDKQSGCRKGPVNTALVIAGVTVCAAPRWLRKWPALLDRPLSIAAAPGLTNPQAGGRGGSMERDSILSWNRGHFLVIIGAK